MSGHWDVFVAPPPPQSAQSWVRVYSWDGEPLADVDMSSGERLSVQWPCRVDFVSISGGGGVVP